MGPGAVKPTRRYDSPRRREQAAATRLAILVAAQRLFERRGYAATTMAAVAEEAGVALKTVYVAFGTKSGVLRGVWHLVLRGDEGDAPMGERPWFRDLTDDPDPGGRLRRMARQSRLVKERAGGVMEVIRGGAATDPDAAALWGRIGSEFRGLIGRVTEGLARDGALRAGLDAEEAADLVWTLSHPDVWQLLVVARGWSPARYEDWLEEALRCGLLADPGPRGATWP